MTFEQMKQFLEVSVAMSAERDREALLTHILDTAMDVSHCDAGTLYLLEEDGLHFCRMVTRSLNIREGGHDAPITLPPVPLNPSHVCARAVLENRLINVPDVRIDSNFDFSGAKRYDAMTGYSTRSMLVVPLSDDRGYLIGVLQLINALRPDGKIAKFPEEVELLVTAFASQAAISVTNMQYSDQIHKLLDSLVGALSTAIDQRTPYNANHTRNMAQYADHFLDWLEQTQNPWVFDAQQRRAFLLSVWLHDVGKLVIPLAIMDKSTRLGKAEKDLENRFVMMELLGRIAFLEGRISEEVYQSEQKRRQQALEFIHRINKVGFLTDMDLAAVQELEQYTYQDETGQIQPWLTAEEITALSIRKGTLTQEERKTMENHAVMTAYLLAQVSFPKMYSQVPVWASAHHELLNGRGYPDHISGDAIPREVRLLTVLDIFDALTARDRPYKAGIPVEKAFMILKNMVQEGSLDGEIVALFEQSKAWEGLL